VLVSRIDRRSGTPIVRMLAPPGERFVAFSANLIAQVLARSIIHFAQTVTP
jgi:hypothetical protein